MQYSSQESTSNVLNSQNKEKLIQNNILKSNKMEYSTQASTSTGFSILPNINNLSQESKMECSSQESISNVQKMDISSQGSSEFEKMSISSQETAVCDQNLLDLNKPNVTEVAPLSNSPLLQTAACFNEQNIPCESNKKTFVLNKMSNIGQKKVSENKTKRLSLHKVKLPNDEKAVGGQAITVAIPESVIISELNPSNNSEITYNDLNVCNSHKSSCLDDSSDSRNERKVYMETKCEFLQNVSGQERNDKKHFPSKETSSHLSRRKKFCNENGLDDSQAVSISSSQGSFNSYSMDVSSQETIIVSEDTVVLERSEAKEMLQNVSNIFSEPLPTKEIGCWKKIYKTKKCNVKLQEQQRALTRREHALKYREAKIAERETEIRRRKEVLKARERELKIMKAQISEREAKISRREEALKIREQKILNYESVVFHSI